MIQSKESLLQAVQARFGETPSDEEIALLENLTDTLSDLETKVSESGDWKAKFEENDSNWRKRYAERFHKVVDEIPEPEHEPEWNEPLTFTDLFSKGE